MGIAPCVKKIGVKPGQVDVAITLHDRCGSQCFRLCYGHPCIICRYATSSSATLHSSLDSSCPGGEIGRHNGLKIRRLGKTSVPVRFRFRAPTPIKTRLSRDWRVLFWSLAEVLKIMCKHCVSSGRKSQAITATVALRIRYGSEFIGGGAGMMLVQCKHGACLVKRRVKGRLANNPSPPANNGSMSFLEALRLLPCFRVSRHAALIASSVPIQAG